MGKGTRKLKPNQQVKLTRAKHKLGVRLCNGRIARLYYRRFKVGKHWRQVLVGPIIDLTTSPDKP